MALGATQSPSEMSIRRLPGGKRWLAPNADNLTAICEPIVYKMWEPRRLTTLWASAVCYSDSFIFYLKDLCGYECNTWMENLTEQKSCVFHEISTIVIFIFIVCRKQVLVTF
jgi:hypothetical protein